MSEAGGSRLGEFGPRFFWRCPRVGCKSNINEIAAWTVNGLNIQKEEHLKKHLNEDREALHNFDQRLLQGPPRDHNKLHLTWADVVFLWSRGVFVDEVDYDKTAKDSKPAGEGMTPGEWARILERAWPNKE
jgi:hypothetical protein